MLLLPTFDAALQPCPVPPASFAAHPQGHFCGQCQRVVQDFTQSANPVADLAAARAAAPDGRVCGQFSAAQVARPRLPQRLRWFLVALGLVLLQGLSAREALGQVLQRKSNYEGLASEPQLPQMTPADSAAATYNLPFVGVVVGHMPTLEAGGGTAAIAAAVQKRIVWPEENGQLVPVEGRLFISFTVGLQGQVKDVEVIKGLHPLLDAAAVRAVQELGTLIPGRLNGRPEEVSFTLPINFRLE